MTSQTRTLLPLTATLLLSGCYSVAPPALLAHPGAPARVGQGTFEVAASVTDYTGGGSLGYGITDAVAVEGGVESNFTDHVMGHAGVRYTPLRPDRRKLAFVLDLEGGFGAGVGGRTCDEDGSCSTPKENLRRPAGGGYLGLGIGGKIHFFYPYLRIRQQLAGARDIPMTSYSTAMAGVQFSIVETVHLWAGTGFIYVVTTEGWNNLQLPLGGWLTYDVGLSITFGGWRQREALEQQRQRRERRERERAEQSRIQ